MKQRTHGKIKDFVDLQSFDDVQDFYADPARALAAYRFTDATSDLLARWLDTLADLPQGEGTALALAGLRGFGKSHALAVFSALVALPQLRAEVADAHVSTSARRLADRRFTVIHVRRGTAPTLIDELIAGFTASFGGAPEQWGNDPATILEVASINAPETTLVIVVDTAYGRAARVSRDDGQLLSELATAAKHVNTLIALALDDDISGADGVNVALAGTYQIDYLDPEHIYRVADLYILRKPAQARDFLHEVYTRLRAHVPGFNWSAQRFTATYPVHPLVADVAASVRLYAPTFAFLPFAATATERALARPALSLVVLDEVFDRIEDELRAADEVKDALAAYDHLATQTIAQLPVMQRLQAKLSLKGLFVLSLDGRGATARELGAAMLFYDENDRETAIARIEEILARFAEAAPADSLDKSAYGDGFRYCFNVTGSSGFEAELAKRVASFEATHIEIDDLLHRNAQARFPDWPLVDEEGGLLMEADFSLSWRGSDRPGRLLWQDREGDLRHVAARPELPDKFFYDWKVAVLPPGVAAEEEVVRSGFDIWAPAHPSAEEVDILRRLAALRSDETLFAQFGDAARAAETSLAARAELIWNRLYVEDAVLIIGGVRYPFTSAARGAPLLGEALAQMYAPVLEGLYPEHPVFTARLGEDEVSNLVSGLFVGTHVTDAASQRLASLFAAPLGLTARHEGVLMPDAGPEMLTRPWIQEVVGLTNAAEGGVVPLDEVYHKLRGRPYGLSREPQQLILAALVAQRRLEFVLTSGEHAGRRALEGPLHWEDVQGVCRSTALMQGAEELTAWARRLTARPDLPLLSDADSREAIRQALSEWLEAWRANRLLERFEELPDQGLTTRASDLAAGVRKTFGATVQAVETVLADLIPLEEGLQRISDAFGDSEDDYASGTARLAALSDYVSEVERRLETRDYLLMAESTTVAEIEAARRELLGIVDDVHTIFDPEIRRRFRLLWQEFHGRYVEHYARAHDLAVGGEDFQRAVDELIGGDDWRDFEMLSLGISLVNKQYWGEAETLLKRVKAYRCSLPVRQLLAQRPFCHCSFRLARQEEISRSLEHLRYLTERGRAAHRRTLEFWSKHLSRALGEIAGDEIHGATDAVAAGRLMASFAQGRLPERFTQREMRLLESALQNTVLPPVRVSLPAGSYGLLTRQELHERLKQWLEELPEHPALVEVVAESEEYGD